VTATLGGQAGSTQVTVASSLLSNVVTLTQTEARITALYGDSSSGVTPAVDEPSIWDAYTYQVLTQPTNGTAAVVNNQLVYTHSAGFSAGGADSFTFSTTNSAGATAAGNGLVHVMSTTGYGKCVATSTSNGAGAWSVLTQAKPCGVYNLISTRSAATGTNVTMQYAVYRPSNGSAPKVVVVLISGGALCTGNTGVAGTAQQLTGTGGNLLVRSAQLFADAGYMAVVVDCPSDRPTPGAPDPTADVDQYRLSVDHAVDILQALRRIEIGTLPVFLSGTSKGSLSVVAQNLIAAGIDMSSPTSVLPSGPTTEIFLSEAGYPNLQPSYIQRPTHVLWNALDQCQVVVPSGLPAHVASLQAAGVAASSDTVSGGFTATAPPAPNVYDVCGPFAYHGYMGLEPTAVATVTAWLDTQVTPLAGIQRPLADYASLMTPSATQTTVDLSLLTRDLDGHALAYALTSSSTVLGGTVTLAGSVVTYTPPASVSNVSDEFVYVTTDGLGGVGAAVVSVAIGP
jgi:hypothetical protein